MSDHTDFYTWVEPFLAMETTNKQRPAFYTTTTDKSPLRYKCMVGRLSAFSCHFCA
ncbi:hypothetical protein [Campylobacter concisus]|uniref:hypothetical protein n=1 Tax=Campylobacter concisus TaxID=199 RepID=UPI001652C3F9|nr:hypothetical protein [Campylobacter concisus]